MSQTQNLGLPIYNSNSKPSWMDTNNGFEKLDNIVGGAASVQLDFANPLYIFDDTHLSYTATEDCWLFGVYCASTTSTLGTISVDGQVILKGYFQDGNGLTQNPTVFVRIARGSTVTISNMNAISAIACYPGEIVSDSFVWNEAIVELDYTNPLHEFTSGNLSYTATKDCWLVGSRVGPSSISINGKTYINGYSGESAYVFYKLSAGDIVTSTGVQSNVFVLDGEIKGSAPGYAGSGDVLELLDFDNAVALTTSNYVAPKAGAVIGTNLLSNSSSNVILTADGVQILSVPASTAAQRDNAVVYGIKKGTVLKLSAAVEPGQCKVLFVPYKYESIAPEITVYNEAEVELDYANPLHTFSAGNLTYTATGDCWLVGDLYSDTGQNLLSINGVSYYRGYFDGGSGVLDCQIPPLKLKKDDVVTVEKAVPYLRVLKGTKVGSVGNLTGAWIPNYSDHIATLAANAGTYTATEDCIVEIAFAANTTDTPAVVSVNGYDIGVAYSSSNPVTVYILNKTINLKKNDVLTWSHAATNLFYGNVFGLM